MKHFLIDEAGVIAGCNLPWSDWSDTTDFRTCIECGGQEFCKYSGDLAIDWQETDD